MGCCESKTNYKNNYNKERIIPLPLEEINQKPLKEALIKDETKVDEFDKNTKISNGSIKSEKNIYTEFFYHNNSIKGNFNSDSKVYLDFKMIKNLKGILKLLFLKFLSKITLNEQLQKINNKNISKIMQDLNKDLELINNKGLIENEEYLSNDVQIILKENQGNNILEYAKYIDSIIKSDEIEAIINIYELEQKVQIGKFLNKMIIYEKYNSYFEEEFTKAQLESIFDYSIVNLVLLDNKNFSKYETAKNICPNCTTKILFHGTQIDPASKIISSEFKYAKRAFYGMGIYFTDNLDYITFYSGGRNSEGGRINFNTVYPPNSTFALIASEVFYNKNMLNHIRNFKRYYVEDLDHFPTYEELVTNYKDKMVPKNGIHFITVKSEKGDLLSSSLTSLQERKAGKFIVNEYVITELEQICPLYALKIKRNEYFVLWRDSNFGGKNLYYDYLKQVELYSNEIAKMNIYIENNTEHALKFIYKRRFNKMILITSIGLDFSGLKFIEIARKILGSDIIVLIYSNNKNHFKWIQNYRNVLYTNNASIYKKYIKNYNERGLKELKKEVEDFYKIKLLDFTNDFLTYPLYIENQKYSDINFAEKSPYIREVIIYNQITNSTLIMNNNGRFEMVNGIMKNSTWDITLLNNEITLYSNGYYLGYNNDSNKIVSDKYMKRLNYITTSNGEYIIVTQNNLLFSVNGNNLNLISNNSIDINFSIFQFIDIN